MSQSFRSDPPGSSHSPRWIPLLPTTTFSTARTTHRTGTASGTVPFVGRSAVLRLAALRLQAGRGTVLTGERGIGKSRTLQAVEAAAESAGLRVGHVTAIADSGPLAPLLSLLPVSDLDSAAAADGLDRALLVRAVLIRSDLQLIAVDDAHLLDGASTALLIDLAAAGTAIALAIDAGTADSRPLAALVEAARAETVELPPFSAGESAELAEAVLHGPVDGGTALELHEAARGVPLILRELLEALLRDGGVEAEEGVWALREAMQAPLSVQLRVLDRLSALDGATRSWVELVALAEVVPADVAETLADDDTADRAELLGWVQLDEAAHAYRLSNAADRASVLAETGPRARRRGLHALIEGATRLQRELTDDERADLGRWRLDAGEHLGQDEALHLAAVASPSDPALAVRFLRVAAQDGGPEAMLALAQHLISTGAIPEAEPLLRRVGAEGGHEARVGALRALASGVGERRSAEALAELEAVLADHPGAQDLLGVQVALLAAEGRSEEAAAAAERLAALPHPAAGAVFGGVYGAIALAQRGEQERALEMAEHLRPLAEMEVGTLPEGPMLQAWLEAAVPWTGARDPRAAGDIAQRGYDRTLRRALRIDRSRFAHLLAETRLLQGDATAAVRLLREAESVPCLWRDSRRPEIVADLVVALVLSGDQPEAERALARLTEIRRTPEQEASYALARAAVLVGRGEREEAADTALAVGDAAEERGERTLAADAWSVATRYGSREAAQRIVEQVGAPAGVVRDLDRAAASALLAGDARAMLAAAQGYWNAEARLLAVESVAAAARFAAAAGDSVTAASATEQLLRWSVATPGLNDPLADAQPLAGLTTREQEIVRMAADGLTDRTIAEELGISVRTAQTHLARAFGKLGVHRRQELARMLPAQ